VSPSSIILAALGSVIVIGLLVALARALATSRVAPPSAPIGPDALAPAAGVEECLAALVRRPTVSGYDAKVEDGSAFASLKADLPRLFPRAHAAMTREEPGDRALLYSWKGTDAALAPVILCAHFDVVPVEDAGEWQHPPFSGDIEGGFVWGRGSQDIKCTLAAMMHAADRLAAAGFRPRRTLYFAFGGDEEAGGLRGARRLGEVLASRKVRASFLLDEGGPVGDGLLSFADRPLALIGISEKGYMDVAVEASGASGHASMPPRRTAVGDLARAIVAIESSPPKPRIGYTVRAFLDGVSPYIPFPIRFLFRNLWLFGPLVKAAFGAGRMTNAMVSTTFAPTMLSGGTKENVLSESAAANVNVRLLPGHSSAMVLARMGRLARRHGAKVRPAHPEAVVEPLPESPADHEGYRAIASALAASFPEAAAVPFLFSAGTDTKHYRSVAEAIYRLTPLRQTAGDLEGVHGRDERVGVDNLRRCELFYGALISSL
jgi:carboxypeptidase PM20D1